MILLLLRGVGSVEFKEDDVTVLDNVGLALLSISSDSLDLSFGSLLLPSFPVHHFSHNKTFLEVSVNASSRLGRLCVLLNNPCLKHQPLRLAIRMNTYSDFVFSGSEEILESEALETVGNDLLELRGSFLSHGFLGGRVGIHEFQFILSRVQNAGCSGIDSVDL